ncbi:MAG: helix-turn-helix domain-containing protein [Candidatus Rifleibacteriota bacterium]
MSKKSVVVFPSSAKELEFLGQRLRDARLRRRFSMETVCARADISRPTLYKVENAFFWAFAANRHFVPR